MSVDERLVDVWSRRGEHTGFDFLLKIVRGTWKSSSLLLATAGNRVYISSLIYALPPPLHTPSVLSYHIKARHVA